MHNTYTLKVKHFFEPPLQNLLVLLSILAIMIAFGFNERTVDQKVWDKYYVVVLYAFPHPTTYLLLPLLFTVTTPTTTLPHNVYCSITLYPFIQST